MMFSNYSTPPPHFSPAAPIPLNIDSALRARDAVAINVLSLHPRECHWHSRPRGGGESLLCSPG